MRDDSESVSDDAAVAAHGAQSERWVTQADVSKLTGIPVSTIDWWQRAGTSPLRTRPRRGSLPTIALDSVQPFADWHASRGSRAQMLEDAARRRQARERRRAEREVERSRKIAAAEVGLAEQAERVRDSDLAASFDEAPPEPPAGLSTTKAADLLGLRRERTVQLVQEGVLSAEKHMGRWYVSAGSVERLLAERSQWLTIARAAQLCGTSEGRIARAIRDGQIEQRATSRTKPSLGRASVESFVPIAEAERNNAAQAAASRARRLEQQQSANRPPETDHEWLSLVDAAEMLGVSRSRVGQLLESERLPHITKGRRKWIRADLLRLVINARAAARVLSSEECARADGLVEDCPRPPTDTPYTSAHA